MRDSRQERKKKSRTNQDVVDTLKRKEKNQVTSIFEFFIIFFKSPVIQGVHIS